VPVDRAWRESSVAWPAKMVHACLRGANAEAFASIESLLLLVPCERFVRYQPDARSRGDAGATCRSSSIKATPNFWEEDTYP
jgi:hypothetical protein